MGVSYLFQSYSSSRSHRTATASPRSSIATSRSRTAPRRRKRSFKKLLFGFLVLLALAVVYLQKRQWALVGEALGSLHHNTADSRAPATWSWHYYYHHGSNDSPRILIAQTSGFDSYLQLLQITQRVNRAYARKHGYDYVALTGLMYGGYQNWHSTFDKIEVLHVALLEQYDAALILDSDALMVDLDVDIAHLVDPKYALTAQQVQKHPHTWDVNAGVILWNLKHSKTQFICDTWRQDAIQTLQGWIRRPMDDQRLLHKLLKTRFTQAQRNETVHAVDQIFQYDKGTLVKHFARHNKNRDTGTWNNPLTERAKQLKRVADDTCLKYKPACEGISSTV